MNMETLGYIVGAIIGTLALILFGWLFVDSFLKWVEPIDGPISCFAQC